MIEHISPISGIAGFSDQYIATAGYDNQVILWDAATKEALARGQHDHLANQCRFSPDGRYLVSSSSDHTARIWQVPSMKLVAVLPHHEDDVESVAISDDNQWIATCSRDHHVRVFDAEGRHHQTLKGHTQDVISVEWVNNAHELISSSDDGTVRRWHAHSGECVEIIDLGGAETDTIVISKAGVIFAANDDGEIIAIHQGERHSVLAHKAGIKRLVYSADRNAIVSLSYDRSVKVWLIQDDVRLEMYREAAIPAIVWPRSCCFSGRNQLAFATFGSSYATFDLTTMAWSEAKIHPTLGANAVLDAHDGVYSIGDAGRFMRQVSGTPAVMQRALPSLCNYLIDVNGVVLTGGQSGEIFAAQTGECIYQHHSPLNCGAVYVKEGVAHAVVGAYTGEVIVLRQDARSQMKVVATHLIQDNAIKGLATDGKQLFSVSATGQAAWHRLTDFELIHIDANAHDKIANGCACLGPNRFASVSRDLKLRLWDGSQSQVFDTPHTFSIKCTAASRDGRYVATGSYGGYVAIYEVQAQQWVKVVRPTSAGISSIAPLANDNGFIASAYDGRLFTLGVAQWEQPRVEAAA